MLNNRHPKTTSDGTALNYSPTLKRAQEILHDLIITACERFTKRPGKSLTLIRYQFVSEENSEGRYYTHFDALVKDQEANELIPLQVIIAVNNLNEWDYPQC